MKTLSIKQPWAYAILHLGKDIENRTWRTNYTGPLLIHAGKSYDKEGDKWLRSQGFSIPDDLPRGGIVGIVKMKWCSKESCSMWWNGEGYAWKFTSPIDLPFKPYKGQLGLFNVTTPLEVD